MLLNRKKPSLLDTTTYVMRSATEALSNRGYNLRDTCADMLLSLTCRSMTEKNNFAWHSDLHAAATKAPNNREYNLRDPNTLLSAKHQSMKKKKKSCLTFALTCCWLPLKRLAVEEIARLTLRSLSSSVLLTMEVDWSLARHIISLVSALSDTESQLVS